MLNRYSPGSHHQGSTSGTQTGLKARSTRANQIARSPHPCSLEEAAMAARTDYQTAR